MINSKISFLITYFNQQDFVKKSLDSILAIKKECDWEILVGDDGSTDNTICIINEYIKKYPNNIKLFIMPRKDNIKYDPILRVSANRLNLLSHATGNYFCVVDGDDWYCDTTFVNEAIQILENDNELSVCAYNFQYCWKDKIQANITDLKEGRNSPENYIKAPYTHAAACVFRQIYKKNQISFMQEFGFFDDNDIMLSSLNNGDLYYIDRIIYSYRQTGNSIWTSLNQFEHKVINAFHYDILKVYCNKYIDAVNNRQFDALYSVWKNRKRYYKILGREKSQKYIKMANSFPDSFFLKLINYNTLSYKEKKSIRLFFKRASFYELYKNKIKNKISKIFFGV